MYVCFTSMRVALLRRRLSRGNLSWPNWLRPPLFREIYLYAEQRYKPKPLTDTRVVLVRASAAERVSDSQMAPEIDDTPYIDIYADELMGWSDIVSDLSVVDVKGGHSSMLWEPHVRPLANALRPYMVGKSTGEPENRDAVQ